MWVLMLRQLCPLLGLYNSLLALLSWVPLTEEAMQDSV